MPLYRRVEKNAQLLEFKCVEFAEELIYGAFKKSPSEGDSMMSQVEWPSHYVVADRLMATALTVAALTAQAPASKTPEPAGRGRPRQNLDSTQDPWGDPDLQGNVAQHGSDRRPDAAAGQPWRKRRSDRRRICPTRRPRPSERRAADLEEFVAPERRPASILRRTGSNADSRSRQTSLVVDPPQRQNSAADRGSAEAGGRSVRRPGKNGVPTTPGKTSVSMTGAFLAACSVRSFR